MHAFRYDAAQSNLDDLKTRLGTTRLPATLPGAPWTRGVPPQYLGDLVEYWRTGYDWRRLERRLNAYPQFVTEIDGVDIHFLHVRSPEPHATPLLLTHGWPGSVLEFLDVIDPLVDPAARGGDPADAFHVVIPSLPGFGFSGAPSEPGWDLTRIALAWAQLMDRLGYHRYVTQGGDIGAWLSLTLAGVDAAHVIGGHVNFLVTAPPPGAPLPDGLGPDDFARLEGLGRFVSDGAGYMSIQSTRPQTLAFALADSPAGQLAWMVEKFFAWSGAQTWPEDALSRDQILDHATLYWLTNTAGTAANLYYEIADVLPTAPTSPPPPPVLPTPLGVAVYLQDSALPVRALAEPFFPNIVQWHEFEDGGHFAAMERPVEFVGDVREFARALKPVLAG